MLGCQCRHRGRVAAGSSVKPRTSGAALRVQRGRRERQQQPPPPRPEEQPRLPDSGPVHEVREHREPNELPPGEQRVTPHELKRANGS
ncbi:DUF6479 family protein [Streptomyces olivochromogenes]|uniref:DUF6479 family protein n=1 Tax=Streptomyces olivochromogenes TaxID=1963 RepID=UPI0031345DA3